jgi:hypothetical protein
MPEKPKGPPVWIIWYPPPGDGKKKPPGGVVKGLPFCMGPMAGNVERQLPAGTQFYCFEGDKAWRVPGSGFARSEVRLVYGERS